MAIEEVEVYEYDGGTVVDPKSETKKVFIPSPPTTIEQKINPRPAIILFGETDVEAIRAKADEEKVVFVLPADAEEETIEATFRLVVTGAKKLNVKADEVSVKFVGDGKDAQAFVEYTVNELDADLEDAEEF
jgi:hypothetical protein